MMQESNVSTALSAIYQRHFAMLITFPDGYSIRLFSPSLGFASAKLGLHIARIIQLSLALLGSERV